MTITNEKIMEEVKKISQEVTELLESDLTDISFVTLDKISYRLSLYCTLYRANSFLERLIEESKGKDD